MAAAAIGLLLAIQVAVVERARPELMAYFNPLAGAEPGHALIDSDLDWGQDMLLLQRELAARGVKEVHYGLFAIVNPCEPGWPENDPAGARETGDRVGRAERAVLPVGAAFQLPARVVRAGGAVSVSRRQAGRVRLAEGVGTCGRVGASVRVYRLGAKADAN